MKMKIYEMQFGDETSYDSAYFIKKSDAFAELKWRWNLLCDADKKRKTINGVYLVANSSEEYYALLKSQGFAEEIICDSLGHLMTHGDTLHFERWVII